jgi:hypothetical protein
MRDSLYDDTAARLSLSPAVRSANGAVNGTAVDMAGTRQNFRVAMLVAVSGAITDGTHTVSLQDSDDGTTGWEDVPAEHRQGDFPAFTTANANTTARVGYSGRRRFVRAVVTTADAPATPVGGTVGAIVLLSQGSGDPVT